MVPTKEREDAYFTLQHTHTQTFWKGNPPNERRAPAFTDGPTLGLKWAVFHYTLGELAPLESHAPVTSRPVYSQISPSPHKEENN